MILVLCLSTAFSTIFGRDEIDQIDTKDVSDSFAKLGKNPYGTLLKSEFIRWGEETIAILPTTKLGNLFLILASQENMRVNPANFVETQPYIDTESDISEFHAKDKEEEMKHDNTKLSSVGENHHSSGKHHYHNNPSESTSHLIESHVANAAGDTSHHANKKSDSSHHVGYVHGDSSHIVEKMSDSSRHVSGVHGDVNNYPDASGNTGI